MTPQPQDEIHPIQISSEAEDAVRDFVRVGASCLYMELKDQEPLWDNGSQLKPDSDGNFRIVPKQSRKLWRIFNESWIRSLPEYDTCIMLLKSDPIIGPHLDNLVGTILGYFRLDPDYLLRSTIEAMCNEEGDLEFTDHLFNSEWRKLEKFFYAKEIEYRLIVPLPNLIIPNLPLRLNKELFLDRLTEEEVTRCFRVGVLRPLCEGFPWISAKEAVGIRGTRFLPKLIGKDFDQSNKQDPQDEGSFGIRPILRTDLIVNDVLSALRLYKHAEVQPTGHASWTYSLGLDRGTSYSVLRSKPLFGEYELSESEIGHFQELWQMLEKGKKCFEFSINRFNLSFDRGLLWDKIVDLVIAAEALFLGDIGVQDRGELRFRFALRAAKFIKHPTYKEKEIFDLMRKAYDKRSTIVHGGSSRDSSLPDNASAQLQTFIEDIEELVRLGLKKGLSMEGEGKNLRNSEYWDSLIFSKSD